MARFLGVDLPRLVYGPFRGKVKRMSLVKVTQGSLTPGQLTGGQNPTELTYRCEGFYDDWPGNFPANQSLKKDSAVQRGDRMVSIFGASLRRGVKPAVNDKIVVGADTWRVVNVGFDAAESTGTSATYKCQVRGP